MFLKNENIILKIRRPKVTDYAALTICILHCDKDFYKYTRKLDFNVEPAITFFLKMLSAFLVCCIPSNALQTRFFHGDFFIEDNVTEEQPKWVHIVCNISYIIKSTISYIRTIMWHLNCHPLI